MKANVQAILKNKYFYILCGIVLLVYLPALIDLVLDWYHDANYSHGFLVPVVSAYLVWRKRKELADIEISSNKSGLILLAAGIILFILGNGASEYFTVRFSLVVIIFGTALYLFGTALTRKIWFALFFLVFMIPVPYVIYFSAAFPMQLLASKVTAWLLDLTGMAVVREGNIIHLPEQALEVAEACSGMRSLVSLLALGAIFAYFYQKKFAAQLILFLSTIPIAVAGNIFRVFVTALIVYINPGTDITEEPIHTIMGASVFVVAFILLMVTGSILRKIFK